ncbi:hypothetical protein D3C76_1801560 [compost metagenome]
MDRDVLREQRCGPGLHDSGLRRCEAVAGLVPGPCNLVSVRLYGLARLMGW